METIKSSWLKIVSDIDDDMVQCHPLDTVSSKIHLSKGSIVLIIIALVVILTLTGLTGYLFVTFFGMLYPTYMSFKAMKSQNDSQRRKWLTYWIIFGFTSSFDTLVSSVLFFIPSFYTMKAIFYLWLFYPKTNGALLIYEGFLHPHLTKIQALHQKIKAKN